MAQALQLCSTGEYKKTSKYPTVTLRCHYTRPWCNAGNVHFHYQAHRLTAVAYKVYLAILAAAALLVFLLCRPAFLMTDLGFLSNSIARSFSSFILACSLVSAF